MLVFLGGFGLWASTAPLAGATIAAGYVAAAGQNIMIQHLEGGIIKRSTRAKAITSRPASRLLTLDSTIAEAQLNRMLKQLAALARQEHAPRSRARPQEQAGNSRPTSFRQSRGVSFPDVIAEQQVEFAPAMRATSPSARSSTSASPRSNEAIIGLDVQKKASHGPADDRARGDRPQEAAARQTA